MTIFSTSINSQVGFFIITERKEKKQLTFLRRGQKEAQICMSSDKKIVKLGWKNSNRAPGLIKSYSLYFFHSRLLFILPRHSRMVLSIFYVCLNFDDGRFADGLSPFFLHNQRLTFILKMIRSSAENNTIIRKNDQIVPIAVL